MSGLLNLLQAASNSAASNVSAPVDGIAWLLRKAGIPVPDAPVGGSDWLAQKGLTAPVQQGAGQVAGDTLGLLAGPVAALKATEIARGLLSAGDNLAAPMTQGMVGGQRGAIVYHGSPHKFDAFDSSKIGTGEGAQAYGHGLYLAESPATASSYRGSVTKFDIPDGHIKGISTLIASRGEDGERLARQAYGADFTPNQLEAAIAQAKQVVESQSSLYKVDLPDEKIARMLDWDKPLSQQAPEVRKAWLATKKQLPPNAVDDLGGDLSLMYGKDVMPLEFLNTWESFGQRAGGEAALQKLGVPGVRYLDGGSRAAGAGTSNYVVFPGEENALRILERNGQLLR